MLEVLAMRYAQRILILAAVVGCTTEEPPCCAIDAKSLRVVNASTAPIDVLVDGRIVLQALAAGQIGLGCAGVREHTVLRRPRSPPHDPGQWPADAEVCPLLG